MHTIRVLPLLATLAMLSACTDPLQPGSPARHAPERARLDSGIYMGTGHAIAPDSVTTPGAERGSGYFGNGN